MGTYLVIANQTALSTELQDGLSTLKERDPEAQFVFLIPATPLPGVPGPQTNLVKHARQTITKVKRAWKKQNLPLLDAVVGSELPFKAIDDMMNSGRIFNGIIVSTLPANVSNWMGQDLPRTVERKWGLPVRHIIASP